MSGTFATDWLCDEVSHEEAKERVPRIRFFKPSELRDFVPDENAVLVGDCHIMRGEVFIIGGEPGVGKSTAATELAVSGATGLEWLGLHVHAPFKTLIIQNENGRYRLSQEYKARGLCDEIDSRILVSEPPPFGMTLTDPEFLADVRQTIDDFRPELVIFDPWNSAAKDDKAVDYTSAFESLRAMLPIGSERPALGIVAHTRKPQSNEKRTGGSGLMHLLAGSYVLSSVPRAIFVMVRGSHDETDNSVVFFNPKNSNGPCAPRSAWERSPSGFRWLPEFDWLEFDGGKSGRKTILTEHLKEALGGQKWSRPEAVKKLMEVSDCGERACQNALKKGGKFDTHLIFDDEKVGYRQ